MYQNRSHQQKNFCKWLVGDTLIKERNSRLPVYIRSPESGLVSVSQQRLKDTFPVLFKDARRSGNRVIDPISRLEPFFESIYDRESCEEAMKLLIPMLQYTSCQYPSCSGFALNPVLESYLDRLKFVARLGDPFMYDNEVQRYLELMAVFNVLQGPLGRDDFPRRPLYPHVHDRGGGLGPRADPIIREMALRFVPSIASGAGPEEIFRHISNHHRLTGNDTAIVERLVEVLRIDEQDALYDLAYLIAHHSGSIVACKILMILDG